MAGTFLKVIQFPVSPLGPNDVTTGGVGVTSILRTYSDTIPESSSITLFLNGQKLPGYAVGSVPIGTPHKFYFTYANNYPSAGVDLVLYATQNYKHSDYSYGVTPGINLSFKSTDFITVEYTISV